MRVRWLHEITAQDVGTAGGKGANLGEMTRLGFPVPRGFCLVTDAYVEHMRVWGVSDELASWLNRKDWQAVEKAAHASFTTRPFIRETADEVLRAYREMGTPPVAVRSSATAEDMADASFAGQQETLLDVRGDEQLLEAVRLCWASLWSARALDYRARRGMDHLSVAMAVVVQEMVPADSAGVLFTADPTTRRGDQMLVQAVRGLGESVVSGRATGDTYRVARGNGMKVVERSLERQGAPVLTDEVIVELCALGLKLETHFSSPQDIEFALAGRRLELLQSRPITALDDAEPEALPPPDKTNWLQRTISKVSDDRYPVAPKPLDQLFFSVLIDGLSHFLRRVGFSVDAAGEKSLKTQVWRRSFLLPRLWPTWRLVKLPFVTARILSTPWDDWWADSRRRLAEVSQLPPLRELPDAELTARADHILLAWHEAMRKRFAFIFGTFAEVALGALVTLAVGPGKAGRVSRDLLAGIQTRVFDLNEALWELAREAKRDPVIMEDLKADQPRALMSYGAGVAFLHHFNAFLAEYGQREGVTWYLSTPTWRQERQQVWRLLRALVEVSAPPPSVGGERYEAARHLVLSRLRFIPGASRPFRRLVERLRALQAFRENSQFDVLRPLDALQELAAEWGRRLCERGVLPRPSDVFYLTYPEVCAWLGGQAPPPDEARKHLARRRATYRLVNARWQAGRFKTAASGGNQLKGIGASPGVVRAPARIIRGEHQFGLLRPGEVLVCHYTSPSWTSLFASAAAVVTETGSAAAHAAIVAREYGIPAVMNVQGATSRIKDGQELLVDGEAGRVTLGEV